MNKNLIYTIIAGVLLLFNIVLAFFIPFRPDFHCSFLIALLTTFVLAIIFRHRFTKREITVARTLLGCLFIFSGFVKGVDPLGTQYVMEDYFIAYGTAWAKPLALTGSFILNGIEFTLGVLLVLNVRMSIVSWLTALMMLFFTSTTLYDALYNPVPDCGCFGKAIILSNWQTFYKNIILDTLVIILIFGRFRVRNMFSHKNENIIAMLTVVLFLGFEAYNVRHLPLIDFLDWKKGTRVKVSAEEALPVEHYYTYKNKTTGESQEFLLKDLPADVRTNWDYVDYRQVNPNPDNIMIPIFDSFGEDGADVSDNIAYYPDYLFIVAVYDLHKTRLKKINRIFEYMDKARQNAYEFIFLTDMICTEGDLNAFKAKVGRDDIDFYYSDDKSIKSIVRSNPGVVLLKDGKIIDKWAWRDLPKWSKVEAIIKAEEIGNKK